jgi:hypothetical protein
MKTGSDAHGITENESGREKHENGTPTPSVPSKMCPSAQNMKTESDALGTVENESESSKHENGTRRPRYHGKRVRERNT